MARCDVMRRVWPDTASPFEKSNNHGQLQNFLPESALQLATFPSGNFSKPSRAGEFVSSRVCQIRRRTLGTCPVFAKPVTANFTRSRRFLEAPIGALETSSSHIVVMWPSWWETSRFGRGASRGIEGIEGAVVAG